MAHIHPGCPSSARECHAIKAVADNRKAAQGAGASDSPVARNAGPSGPYDTATQRLVRGLGPYPLFECDERCGCSADCANRRVQRLVARGGSLAVPVEVFRTESCGHGVRALSDIERGELVCLYHGELLMEEMVETRVSDDQYLLDLVTWCHDAMLGSSDHGAEADAKLCVNPERRGSVARWLNHSCNPNLVKQQVGTLGLQCDGG